MVRSGTLTSVHAFAVDPGRASALWLLLAAHLGIAALGFQDKKGSGSRPASINSGLYLMLGFAALLTLGNLIPLGLSALGFAEIALGGPYYQLVSLPFLLGMVLLSLWQLFRSRRLATICLAVLIVLIGLILLLELDFRLALILFGIALAVSLFAASMKLRKNPAMALGHFSFGVLVLAASLNLKYQASVDMLVAPGESFEAFGRSFVAGEAKEQAERNYVSRSLPIVELSKDGQEISSYLPEKRVYPRAGLVTTESELAWRFGGDLLLIPAETSLEGKWLISLRSKPLMLFIWASMLGLASAGLLASLRREV